MPSSSPYILYDFSTLRTSDYVSLITSSMCRYEGLFHEYSPSSIKGPTITLKDVRSFGTEFRTVPGVAVYEPSPQIYAFIVFRAAEIVDLRIIPPRAPPLSGIASSSQHTPIPNGLDHVSTTSSIFTPLATPSPYTPMDLPGLSSASLGSTSQSTHASPPSGYSSPRYSSPSGLFPYGSGDIWAPFGTSGSASPTFYSSLACSPPRSVYNTSAARAILSLLGGGASHSSQYTPDQHRFGSAYSPVVKCPEGLLRTLKAVKAYYYPDRVDDGDNSEKSNIKHKQPKTSTQNRKQNKTSFKAANISQECDPADTSLATAMSAFVGSAELSDVTFVVGRHGTRFYAHRVILCARSEVFRRMLSGYFREANTGIEIPLTTAELSVEISPAAFRSVLEYCYTDQCHVASVEGAFDALALAEYFLLAGMRAQCTQIIIKNLTAENVCAVWSRAHNFPGNELFREGPPTAGIHADLQRVCKACLEFFLENFEVVVDGAGFLSLDGTLLTAVVADDSLSVTNEFAVWNAVITWAKAQVLAHDAANSGAAAATAAMAVSNDTVSTGLLQGEAGIEAAASPVEEAKDTEDKGEPDDDHDWDGIIHSVLRAVDMADSMSSSGTAGEANASDSASGASAIDNDELQSACKDDDDDADRVRLRAVLCETGGGILYAVRFPFVDKARLFSDILPLRVVPEELIAEALAVTTAEDTPDDVAHRRKPRTSYCNAFQPTHTTRPASAQQHRRTSPYMRPTVAFLHDATLDALIEMLRNVTADDNQDGIDDHELADSDDTDGGSDGEDEEGEFEVDTEQEAIWENWDGLQPAPATATTAARHHWGVAE